MRCYRFLKIFVLTLAFGWLASSCLLAQSQAARFSDRDDKFAANPVKSLPDGDYSKTDIVVSSDECDNPYEPTPQEPGRYHFKFWESIVVHSGLKQSRCVVLQNLPFSGYYNVKVVAMYSKSGGYDEDTEEYRFAVVAPESTIIGAVIPDQNPPGGNTTGEVVDVKEKADKYLYVRNDHGFQYLQKGDNIIRFYAGSQYANGGNVNSVDFYSIEVTPPPHIIPEPEFTAGYSNTIDWLGIDDGAIAQEIQYFDESSSLAKRSANQSLGKKTAGGHESTTINGLEDGHKYGYYVEAYPETGGSVRSDTTFSTQDATPPGRVTIDSMMSLGNQIVHLFWSRAEDAVSGVREYQIIRSEDNSMETAYSVIDTIPAASLCQDGGRFKYCYVDVITDPDAMNKEYKYRIDAVDSVGNKSTGFESKLVVGVPTPVLTISPPAVADSFYKGARITLKADVSMLALPASHKIKFQAARENVKFFDGQFGAGKYFFESNGLPLSEGMTEVMYTFDLTGDSTVSKQFIDGHKYLFRAQLQDLQGNLSRWSYDVDSLFVIPDCFPPDDISFLDVEAITNDDDTEGWMDLSWGGADDHTSGIDSFVVYRKVENVDSTFQFVASTTDEFYQDAFEAINFNGDVSYRIGSVDRVGNRRDSLNTKFEATVRSQTAPTWNMVNVDVIDGKNYLIKDRKLQIDVSLDNFKKNAQELNILAKMNGEDYPVLTVHDSNSDSLGWGILLPNKIGDYTISLRALFPSKAATLWSRPQVVRYDTTLSHGSSMKWQSQKAKATNYPNPFNLSTTISYVLEKDTRVTVDIYNVQGRKIKSLANEYMGKGRHSLIWDGYNAEGNVVSSGIFYFKIQFESENGERSSIYQKMLLIK